MLAPCLRKHKRTHCGSLSSSSSPSTSLISMIATCPPHWLNRCARSFISATRRSASSAAPSSGFTPLSGFLLAASPIPPAAKKFSPGASSSGRRSRLPRVSPPRIRFALLARGRWRRGSGLRAHSHQLARGSFPARQTLSCPRSLHDGRPCWRRTRLFIRGTRRSNTTGGERRWSLQPCLHLLLVPALFMYANHNVARANTHSTPAGPPYGACCASPRYGGLSCPAPCSILTHTLSPRSPQHCSAVSTALSGNSNKVTGILYLLGGVSGGLLAGYLGDRILHSRKDGRLLCAAVMALVTIPLACIGIMQPRGSIITAAVFLGMMYASLSSYYGFVYSAIQDIVPPNQRASAMAIYFMAMYMCGASLGPLLTGKLSDVLAHRAAALAGSPSVTETFRAVGLQQAMLIIPVLCTALAFVLYMGSRTIIADMAKREAAAHVVTADAS